MINNVNRFLPNGSLNASVVDGLVSISYNDTDNVIAVHEYTQFIKEDNSPAGANITEVVDYLNSEFDKASGTNSFCRYELTDNVTLSVDLTGGVNDLNFNSEIFNTNTDIFSNSSGTITVSQDGIYNASTCVVLESPTLQAISKSQIGLFVNDVLVAMDTNETTLAAGQEVTALNLSSLINLSSGDEVKIKVSLYGTSANGRSLRLVNLFGTTANPLSNFSISKL